ncbi:MAG: sigma-70 family RNA polymerase sigma factor [Flavobacteriaceae bacterium]|nr:sigma-70 family RNA polymerase sigma factor [Flavobacteriaceae bacterium]
MAKPLFKNVCNEQVFSQLYKKWSKDLYNFIYYRYGERIGAEDKVQEAFVKLWKHCKETPPEKAKSFLFTIANNLSLNDIKHQKVVLKYQEHKPKEHTNVNPEFLLEEKEYMKKFQNALSKLSEGQREAFLLNRVEGKRHKEIAELLGISRKAVEKRIYAALDNLRKEIDGI